MIIDVILSNCFIRFSINQGSGKKKKKILQVDLFYTMCKKMCYGAHQIAPIYVEKL